MAQAIVALRSGRTSAEVVQLIESDDVDAGVIVQIRAHARLEITFRRNRLQAFRFCLVPRLTAVRKVSASCPIERSPAAIVVRNLLLRPESKRSTRSVATPSPSVAPAAVPSARRSVMPAGMTAVDLQTVVAATPPVAAATLLAAVATPPVVAVATRLGRASSIRRSAPSVARRRKFRSSRATTSRSTAVSASSYDALPLRATGTATRLPAPGFARGSRRFTVYRRVRPGSSRPVASPPIVRVIAGNGSPSY